MTFLLDQGLPRSTVEELKQLSSESIHVGNIGMAAVNRRFATNQGTPRLRPLSKTIT